MSTETPQQEIFYNLTAKMAPFLDSHQILHLIDFQINHVSPPVFNPTDLEQERLKIMKKLDMVEETWESECQIRRLPEGSEMDREYQERHDEVENRLEDYLHKVDAIKEKLGAASDGDLFTHGKDNNRIWITLKDEYGFVESDLETLYESAMASYKAGDYEEADNTLYVYSSIAPLNDKRHFSSLWGQVASAIQLLSSEDEGETKFQTATKTLDDIKDTIDKKEQMQEKPLIILQHRCWLLHWALFIYFSDQARKEDSSINTSRNTEYLINLCLNYNTQTNEENPYKNAIETLCPWLLRYLAVIIVTSKQVDKKQQRLKKLIELIDQESYQYRDPITDFLLGLNKKYDFEAAQKSLAEAKDVLRSDYFLHTYVDQFIESGRILIFEMFCRIHKKIKVSTIAEKLNMTQEDAELWIVELIRNAQLHAKIDGESGTIIMGCDPDVPYQQILNKTRQLQMSTSMLIKNLERKMQSQQEKNKVPNWARQNSVQSSGKSPRQSYS